MEDHFFALGHLTNYGDGELGQYCETQTTSKLLQMTRGSPVSLKERNPSTSMNKNGVGPKLLSWKLVLLLSWLVEVDAYLLVEFLFM